MVRIWCAAGLGLTLRDRCNATLIVRLHSIPPPTLVPCIRCHANDLQTRSRREELHNERSKIGRQIAPQPAKCCVYVSCLNVPCSWRPSPRITVQKSFREESCFLDFSHQALVAAYRGFPQDNLVPVTATESYTDAFSMADQWSMTSARFVWRWC